MAEGKAFADAERFVLEGDDGAVQTWVVLAISEMNGTPYALLAPEEALDGADGSMDVIVFEYHRDDDGDRRLGEVSDEATYEAAYRQLAELMGLEAADES